MTDQKKDAGSLSSKLVRPYRVVLMNHETFEEISSYRLSLLGVLVTFFLLSAFIGAVIVSIIFFTPARKLVPGYGKVDESSTLFQLNNQIDTLEKKLEEQRTYTENFRKMLIGGAEHLEDMPKTVPHLADSQKNVERIEEDEQLRLELEKTEQYREDFPMTNLNIESEYVPLEQIYFTPPVKGPISAGFMLHKKHYGVDILASKNTPIKAALDGYIISSDWTLETGQTIGIQHKNNLLTFYKHNSALLKKAGDFVKAGEAIAIIGNSGTLSSGPHLHFELWHEGKPLDPVEFVNFE